MSKTFDHNPKSGIYDINEVCHTTTPFGLNFSPMQAHCNMESGDGGWIILVRRTPDVAERVSFKKSWVEYENGFGNLSGEFWYGLKNMHCLTSREPMEVEVELRKTGGTKLVLSYSSFKVDGPDTSYTLHVSGKQYKGSDYFQYHNGMKFSTFDRDNDPVVVQKHTTTVETGLITATICISLTCRNLSFILVALIPTTTLSYECVPKVV